MTRLFKRFARVLVGTLEISELDVAFNVVKSLKPEPNTCEISIWNLNEDHRAQLEEAEVLPVELEVGYEEGSSTIFRGDLRTATSLREGPDIITKITGGDGEQKVRQSRINTSIAKGTKLDAVIKQTAKALGVGTGNLDKVAADLQFSTIGQMFAQGTVLSGSAQKELDKIAESAGLEWSIQDGSLQLLKSGEALLGLSISLTPETGMIGAPTVDNDGILTVRMLMIPDVFPGRQISIDSERIKGDYRIERATFAGETSGNDWGIEVEAKRL